MKFLLLATLGVGALAAALPLGELDSTVDLVERGILSAAQQGVSAFIQKPEKGISRLGNAKKAWALNRSFAKGQKQLAKHQQKSEREQAKFREDKHTYQMQHPQGPLPDIVAAYRAQNPPSGSNLHA